MAQLNERDDEPDDDDLSDVRHPDHDLSEWGIAYDRGEPRKPWYVQRWVQILIAVIVIASLVLPFIQRF